MGHRAGRTGADWGVAWIAKRSTPCTKSSHCANTHNLRSDMCISCRKLTVMTKFVFAAFGKRYRASSTGIPIHDGGGIIDESHTIGKMNGIAEGNVRIVDDELPV